MHRFDVAEHPLVLATPHRLTTQSAWIEHIPFAFAVTRLVQPRLIVELGTHAGDSYCALCQAVATLELPCRCYAVDTWRGDEQAGHYDESVLTDLRNHHDEAYGSFSVLLQSTFDEAVDSFEDGSIDLLHIDGYHTYEAVRHDFETWLPKLSRRAVVLLHDTNERGGDFGVWRFWAEVATRYPGFAFEHGHGLGVLSVGPDEPPELAAFRGQLAEEPWVRTLFFELGRRLWLRTHLSIYQRHTENLLEERSHLQSINRTLQEAVEAKDQGLAVQQEALADKDRGLAAQLEALAHKDGNIAELQGLYQQAHQRLTEREVTLAELQEAIDIKDRAIDEREAALGASRAEAAALREEVTAIRQRTGYRALESTIRQVDRLAPWPTRRRKALLAGARVARLAAAEGPLAVAKRLPTIRSWGPMLRAGTPQHGLQALPPGASATLDDEYQLWLRQHAPTPAALAEQRAASRTWPYRPRISLVMPVYNTRPEWLYDAVESVRAQTYGNWELCIVDDASSDPATRRALRAYRWQRRIRIARLGENAGIAAASNRGLELATGEFVGFLDHDDLLKPNAMYEVVALLNRRRDLDFIYSDEDKLDPDGRLVDPFFKPDWSPELLLTTNYVTHFAVYRASMIDRVGRLRRGYDGSQDHDLALRITEATDRIAHIPLPLYTWRKVPGSAAASPDAKPWAYVAGAQALRDALRRRGLEGDVGPGLWKGSHRVRFRVQGDPSVGILIPTRDRVDLLRRCIESVERCSTYPNFELLIVDNGSREPETLEYLAQVKGRVIEYPGAFNFAHMMNLAAHEARTDMLVFLNNDTEVIAPGWMEAMLEFAQQAQVGAVGARLLYPEGHPQHEGVIMGLGRGTAGNVDHGGYFSLGQSVLNASAVTAACMMTRAKLFCELGGFDEALRVAFNDVDFCLRVVQAGYRIVYTPYAELYHFESASRGNLHPPEDETFFRRRWGDPGEITDPYYNPNLDLMRPFRIDVGGEQ